MRTYPLRHISIRVPWHDTSWDGRVCANPRLNGSCLKLKNIGQNRDDAAEEAVHGQSLKDLPEEKWPCCVSERVGFMAPLEYTRTARHPYNRGPEGAHGHFAPTPLRHFSVPAVPSAWMLEENMAKLAEEHALDVQAEREPNLGFDSAWIQHHENQKALLDCFAGHLRGDGSPKQSLCFFYAKKVPFVEDYGASRILIGVGRVTHVSLCRVQIHNQGPERKVALRAVGAHGATLDPPRLQRMVLWRNDAVELDEVEKIAY